MEVMHEHVAGLDAPKETIVTWLLARQPGVPDTRHADVRSRGLAELADGERVYAGSDEATRVYWKRVWNILSEGTHQRSLIWLTSAAHMIPPRLCSPLRLEQRCDRRPGAEQKHGMDRLET
jgi:hypothetical protein